MEFISYIGRLAEATVRHALERGRSLFLFGPRQTGKTTLVSRHPLALTVSLAQPETRLRYERSPGALRAEVEALDRAGPLPPTVAIDELQKVPALLDSVQDLIDRGVARFVLTGSSARKLRRGTSENLLPGRASVVRLDPLSLEEYRPARLEDALLDGTLPGIVAVRDPVDREADLSAYVITYLEEEIRAEAAVRNLGAFARFLELAAGESGGVANYRRLSQDVGVAHTTIASYHQILEDCLVSERVEPLTSSPTRRKLTRSDKYLLFDLGVRRLAAREGRGVLPDRMGQLFEQWVGLELVRWSRHGPPSTRVRFWRDPDGPEVDWVVDVDGRYVPIEVRWTESPAARDARHLRCFLDEYPSADQGYVVCRAPRRMALADRVTAVPWQDLPEVLPGKGRAAP